MPSIVDIFSDEDFLREALFYLERFHGIRSVVVDSQNRLCPLPDRPADELPASRFYPLSGPEDIGGIRCSANTAADLAAAEPHIRFCLEGLQRMIEKDAVLEQTTDEMLRLSGQLHFVFGLAAKLSGIQDIDRYCRLVLEEVSGAIGATVAFIHVKDQRGKAQIVVYNLGYREAEQLYRDRALRSLAGSRTVIVALSDGASALAAPIEEKGLLIGHMVFVRESGRNAFSSYDRQFVSIVNNIISPTIETLDLYHSLHALYLNTVKALAAAIDAKDAYTHGHSFRVAKYAVAIARQLKVEASNLTHLEIAAYMHDLGKIGVSESILGKRGRLSAEEFEEIKKHPVLTNKILEPIELPELIVDATLHHHERMDGRGYPSGLKGESISLFARIIAVADVFDALTSARPYREAMTMEDALTMICEGVDTEYDRNVVYAFIEALRHKSRDKDLSMVCSDLRSFSIERMNGFLENLIGYLVGAAASGSTRE